MYNYKCAMIIENVTRLFLLPG